jgi:hypothetical protein
MEMCSQWRKKFSSFEINNNDEQGKIYFFKVIVRHYTIYKF